jgi:hypothetical protein
MVLKFLPEALLKMQLLLLDFYYTGSNKRIMFFKMPFYTAEQRNKERKNDSAEHPKGHKLRNFPKRPLFMSSTGNSAASGTSKGLSFLLVRFL